MPILSSPLIWNSASVLLVGALAGAYVRGWRRLPPAARPTPRRALAFALALLLALVATTSRLDRLVNSYFTARAVQHLLLVELTPLLFWLGTPWRPLDAALPALRAAVTRRPALRRALTRLTQPGVVWAAFVSLFWLWHDSALLALTARQPWLHRLEIGVLSGVALLYWWHISAAAPHLHRALADWQRIAYAFAGLIPIKLTGIVMLFDAEMDGAPADAVRFAVGPWLPTDTAVAAIFIWIVGGVMFLGVMLWLGGRALGIEERKGALPDNPIERPDLWRLPRR